LSPPSRSLRSLHWGLLGVEALPGFLQTFNFFPI
ncbi:hypothetical protein M2137_002910, partial [Parabacteroides sp. PFB2-10]|nr:hypothetical protein [Parabacteroides sp. PFB2-10]